MTRFIHVLAVFIFLFASPAFAENKGEIFKLEDRGIGNDKTPKFMIEEYASFTCPHCAEFHKKVFPELKKKYIDSGIAYFVYTDFPWDDTAMDAAVASRCMPKDKYFAFIDALFSRQDEWAFNGDHEIQLGKLAEQFGVPASQIAACLKNESIKRAIVTKMEAASQRYMIESTPTLMLDYQQKIDAGNPKEEVFKAIDDYAATLK